MVKKKASWTYEDDILFEGAVKSLSEGPPPKESDQYFVRLVLHETKRMLFTLYLERWGQLLYDMIPPSEKKKPRPSNISHGELTAFIESAELPDLGPYILKKFRKAKEYDDPTEADDPQIMAKIRALEKTQHIDEEIAILLVKEAHEIIYGCGKRDGYWRCQKERENTAGAGPGVASKELGECQMEKARKVLEKYGGFAGYKALPRGKKKPITEEIENIIKARDIRNVYNIINKIGASEEREKLKS